MGYIGKDGNDKVGKEDSKDGGKDGSTDHVFSDSHCQLTEVSVLEQLDVITNLESPKIHHPLNVFSF